MSSVGWKQGFVFIMEKEKYFQLGIIKKEHGLNGRMLLLLDDAIDTLSISH